VFLSQGRRPLLKSAFGGCSSNHAFGVMLLKRSARFVAGKGGKEVKDNLEKSSGRRKKPYVRPELKQVQLKPEEAVLGFCKTTSIFGPGVSGCNTPSQCYALGS
jgi:hypothetical protein